MYSSTLMEVAPAILEASGEAVLTADAEGHIQGHNANLRGLLEVDAETCATLKVQDLLDGFDAILGGGKEPPDYWPSQLTKPDGSSRWVLVKVISIGSGADIRWTVLIQDPETIRRVVDRLDYIENHDVSTGLLNRSKGLLALEAMQANQGEGGCLLVKLSPPDAEPDGDLSAHLRVCAERLGRMGQQNVTFRLSDTEAVAIHTADIPLSKARIEELIADLKTHEALGDLGTHSLSYKTWHGTEIPPPEIIDSLRANTHPIDIPDLADRLLAGVTSQPQGSLARDLSLALDAGALDFFIQPQVNAVTGEVIGGELLIRWIHESGEIIPPSKFVDLLEQGPLAQRFLTWSMERAAEFLNRVRDALGHWIPLSLNVPAPQFTDEDLVTPLLRTFDRHGVPYDRLELEITERLLADDPNQVVRVLRALRDKGFKIAIDDFGTGYSSLTYLRRFPLNRLKIDRAFVTNLAENEEDRLISTAITALAHALGLEVIAEGVETQAQAAFLNGIDCEFYQGYLTGKPQPLEAFIETARRSLSPHVWDTVISHPSSVHRFDHEIKPVSWKKSFSTDLVSIDNEHRDLIEHFNDLARAATANPDQVDLVAVMDTIGAETIRHFTHEEQIMKNINYDQYEAHKEKHKWLIIDLAKQKAEIRDSTDPVNVNEVLNYVKYWLLRHLISEDTRIKRFINQTQE